MNRLPIYRLSKPALFAIISLFSLLIASTPTLQAQSPLEIRASREYWMGMYLGTDKVGYTQVTLRPTKYKKQPVLEMNSIGKMALKMFGSVTEQNSFQRTLVDRQGRPLLAVYDITSKTSNLHLETLYNYKTSKVVCRLGKGSEATTKILTIPAGATILADTNISNLSKKIKPGTKMTQYTIDPISIEFQKVETLYVGKQRIKDPVTGKMVQALHSRTKLPQVEMHYWEAEDGDFLRGEMGLGPIKIVMQKETKQGALNAKSTLAPEKGYVPPKDFAVATAIVADKAIKEPRKIKSLDLHISGIPSKELILSDTAQTVEGIAQTEGLYKADYKIRATLFDAQNSLQYPVKETNLQPYLAKAPYLDTENPNIVQTAKKIRGEETNLYKIAVAIRDWVSKNMTPDPSIGVPRTATDIFNNRRGVCRDYSTLYAAIARAAGIPTRLCGGIVYAEGRFFYHAWVECYVGEWVVFDPTLHNLNNPVDYVDATHVKFAQGDVMQMFKVVAIVGKLQIKVQQEGQ